MTMSKNNPERRSFIADRMLGTLTRYLRFLGYDVKSANSFQQGNRREDTRILEIANQDGRIVITRDRELARRGGSNAILMESDDVLEQLNQLLNSGVIRPEILLRMERCSLCNTRLRPATAEEIEKTDYAPSLRDGIDFFWCPICRKLYWMGSHGRNLTERLREYLNLDTSQRD